MKAKGRKKTCPNGHVFYKSSDCPTCPTCAKKQSPAAEFLAHLTRPARSALEREGISSLKKLSGYTERQVLDLHGVGPASLPTLRALLSEAGLSFREKKR